MTVYAAQIEKSSNGIIGTSSSSQVPVPDPSLPYYYAEITPEENKLLNSKSLFFPMSSYHRFLWDSLGKVVVEQTDPRPILWATNPVVDNVTSTGGGTKVSLNVAPPGSAPDIANVDKNYTQIKDVNWDNGTRMQIAFNKGLADVTVDMANPGSALYRHCKEFAVVSPINISVRSVVFSVKKND